MMRRNFLLFLILAIFSTGPTVLAQVTHHAVNDNGTAEIGYQFAQKEPCEPPFFRSGGSFDDIDIGDETGGNLNSDAVVLSFDTLTWDVGDNYTFFVDEMTRFGMPFEDLGLVLLEVADSPEALPTSEPGVSFGEMELVASLSEAQLLDVAGIDLTETIRDLLLQSHERYFYIRLRFQTCTDADETVDLVRLNSGGPENPASPRIVQSGGSGGRPHKLYFAQFADGAVPPTTLASQLVLVNPSDTTAADVRVILQTNSGAAMNVDINGEAVAGVLDLTIAPGAIVGLGTDGQGMLQQGSVVVCSDIPLFGTVLFQGSVGFAGVGSSTPLTEALAPVRVEAAAGSNTGLAMMSLGDSVNLELTLKDRDGMPLAQAELELAPNAQDARFASQYPWDQAVDFEDFAGTIEVSGDAEFAAIVILLRPDQFATLPVRDLSN